MQNIPPTTDSAKHVRDKYFFFHFAMVINVITELNISHILLTPWLLDEKGVAREQGEF